MRTHSPSARSIRDSPPWRDNRGWRHWRSGRIAGRGLVPRRRQQGASFSQARCAFLSSEPQASESASLSPVSRRSLPRTGERSGEGSSLLGPGLLPAGARSVSGGGRVRNISSASQPAWPELRRPLSLPLPGSRQRAPRDRREECGLTRLRLARFATRLRGEATASKARPFRRHGARFVERAAGE
jgi:hypothetical protein